MINFINKNNPALPKKIISSAILLIFLVACSSPPPDDIEIIETEDTSVKTDEIELVNDGLVLLPLEETDKNYIAYDFHENACNAKWTNNGEELDCPGSLENITSGVVINQDEAIIEGNILVELPSILTIPAQQESQFYAIFGIYPAFLVQENDRFKATLACENEHFDCDVNFSLEYKDEYNNYGTLTAAKWEKRYNPEGDYIYADFDLSLLANRKIQFILALRDNDNPTDDYAIWINPLIWRDPNFIPESSRGTNDTNDGSAMSIISGSVEMTGAPPYLFESNLPLAVVMFNLTDNTYWWIHTTGSLRTFQMTVSPGDYRVIAYGLGVGNEDYVSAAYTGKSPSCGNDPQIFNVSPGEEVNSIVINDWNWLCSGNGLRPEIPSGVPIPK